MQKNISNDISLFYSTQVKLYENGWIESPYSKESTYLIFLFAAIFSVSSINLCNNILNK